MTDADRGQVGIRAAEVYEEFFIPALFGQWAPQIVDLADVAPGDAVLDVGCGTGVLARAANEVTGAGRVIGLDPNEGMLGVARRSSNAISWRQGVAEDLPFPSAEFDAVLSQFAMMFFSDRSAAVREMARVVVAEGVVVVATWASLDLTPGYAAMVSLLDRLFGSDAAAALKMPFVLGDPDELSAVLSPSFESVDVSVREGTARFESIDSWVRTDVRGWTLSDMIDDRQFEELQREARSSLTHLTTENGSVAFPAPALVAICRRPIAHA